MLRVAALELESGRRGLLPALLLEGVLQIEQVCLCQVLRRRAQLRVIPLRLLLMVSHQHGLQLVLIKIRLSTIPLHIQRRSRAPGLRLSSLPLLGHL